MLTVYVLHNKTRLKREDIKRNLNDLMEIRWVKETRMANKMYTLDLHNEYVIQLVSFSEVWAILNTYLSCYCL